ncbi:hypothetical protein LK490_22750, partial [Blautia sp. MSK22_86]|nr:hypothetical protein [Blautia sp. MSK22_86]
MVRAKGARSFGDAVSKALAAADLDSSTRAVWMLHDDSRPSVIWCLVRLFDVWSNASGAGILGCK